MVFSAVQPVVEDAANAARFAAEAATLAKAASHLTQKKLAELYDMPAGYEVVLGNGGSTTFWDVALCSLVDQRSAHGVFGEFTRKFATASAAGPAARRAACSRRSLPSR